MRITNPTAKKGEDEACSYLRTHGYIIIERNFHSRYGEIDIVAIDKTEGRKNETLVFVEVKTRTSKEFGDPLEAITYWKLKSIQKAAQYYVHTHPKMPKLLRMDAVSILYENSGSKPIIKLIKNIGEF